MYDPLFKIASLNYLLAKFNPYPANIFCLKMLSANYICCMYSNALKIAFMVEPIL